MNSPSSGSGPNSGRASSRCLVGTQRPNLRGSMKSRRLPLSSSSDNLVCLCGTVSGASTFSLPVMRKCTTSQVSTVREPETPGEEKPIRMYLARLPTIRISRSLTCAVNPERVAPPRVRNHFTLVPAIVLPKRSGRINRAMVSTSGSSGIEKMGPNFRHNYVSKYTRAGR